MATKERKAQNEKVGKQISTFVSEDHSEVRPRLVLTHGEKGGVGKTTVARLIADFWVTRGAAFRAFDAEGPTGQLLRFFPSQTSPVDVGHAEGIAPVLDYLMDGTGGRLALVDLGARSGEEVAEWLHKGGALEEAEAGNLGITVVYVAGGTVDSVGHLKQCYAALGSDAGYVVVKNRGVADKFDVYDGSNIRKDLQEEGAKEMAIPALDRVVYQSVDRASASFSDFCEGKGTSAGYTERRYCRTWLRECFAMLEELGEWVGAQTSPAIPERETEKPAPPQQVDEDADPEPEEVASPEETEELADDADDDDNGSSGTSTTAPAKKGKSR